MDYLFNPFSGFSGFCEMREEYSTNRTGTWSTLGKVVVDRYLFSGLQFRLYHMAWHHYRIKESKVLLL
jgi:hypothetical protein